MKFFISSSILRIFLGAATLISALLLSGPATALDLQQPAPDFSLNVMANGQVGSKLNLKDYRGKVVYIDFWASWCGPCRKSLPALNEIRNRYSRQQFEIIAINLDENPDDALNFLREHVVDYPVVYDLKQKTPGDYQVEGMPTAFLIDQQGVVRYIHSGFKGKDADHIDATIKRLLEERK